MDRSDGQIRWTHQMDRSDGQLNSFPGYLDIFPAQSVGDLSIVVLEIKVNFVAVSINLVWKQRNRWADNVRGNNGHIQLIHHLRWTSAVSCDDLPCTPEKTEYSDQVAQCKHLNSTQRCLQTYTKTCKGNIPKDRQEYVNKLLTNTTTLRNFQCLNQVLCEDIKFCDTFDEKINKELEKNNFAQACRYFQDFVRCMNLSKDDCRREDSIDPTTSEQIQQILRANENWITANCSTAQRFQGV
ncbi:hypothetical protein Btru_022766 [Bulinus truncatus]|nr:hypothetical protein Btru_022766 [Bulinus truncatus]